MNYQVNRRLVLFGGTSAAMLIGAPAWASVICNPVSLGMSFCDAGIQSPVAQIMARQQSKSLWCWAASISMVFAYFGYDVDQSDIVYAIQGALTDAPGSVEQIMKAVNARWTDRRGRQFDVIGDVLTANIVSAANDLANDHPLLVGTMSHCMVLTSVRYLLRIDGVYSVQEAIVRDPWPASGGRRILSPNEWYNVNFLCRLRVVEL